jgi:hypothetical protein
VPLRTDKRTDVAKVIIGNASAITVPRQDRDSLWLQIKSDNVEEMRWKILEFGATKIDLPLPDLYFQAPGGQCFQLLPITEDQSYYKGTADGSNLAQEEEAEVLKEKAVSEFAASTKARHKE